MYMRGKGTLGVQGFLGFHKGTGLKNTSGLSRGPVPLLLKGKNGNLTVYIRSCYLSQTIRAFISNNRGFLCVKRELDITCENGLQWDFGHVRKMEKFQTCLQRESEWVEQRFRYYQERALCLAYVTV